MMDRPSLPLLPVACTLTAADGAAQLVAWQRFNDDHLIHVQRAPGRVTVDYADVEDAAERLAALVRTEQTCCAFAEWRIQRGSPHLQLIVTGAEDGIASLTILDRIP